MMGGWARGLPTSGRGSSSCDGDKVEGVVANPTRPALHSCISENTHRWISEASVIRLPWKGIGRERLKSLVTPRIGQTSDGYITIRVKVRLGRGDILETARGTLDSIAIRSSRRISSAKDKGDGRQRHSSSDRHRGRHVRVRRAIP